MLLIFLFQNNCYNYFITPSYPLFVRRGLSPLLFYVLIPYLVVADLDS